MQRRIQDTNVLPDVDLYVSDGIVIAVYGETVANMTKAFNSQPESRFALTVDSVKETLKRLGKHWYVHQMPRGEF